MKKKKHHESTFLMCSNKYQISADLGFFIHFKKNVFKIKKKIKKKLRNQRSNTFLFI